MSRLKLTKALNGVGEEANISLVDFNFPATVEVEMSGTMTVSVQSSLELGGVKSDVTGLTNVTASTSVALDNPVANLHLSVSASDDGSYSGTSFAAAQVMGTFRDLVLADGYFWLLDDSPEQIHKYTYTGVYTGISFPTNVTGVAVGLTSAMGGLYIATTDGSIVRYEFDGTLSGTAFSTAAQDADARGIGFDGTYFYVAGRGTSTVYKYTKNGGYTGESFSVASEVGEVQGATATQDFIWVVDSLSDGIYKYDLAGNYLGVAVFTSAEDSTPQGVTVDAACLWAAGNSTVSTYKYDLSLTTLKVLGSPD